MRDPHIPHGSRWTNPCPPKAEYLDLRLQRSRQMISGKRILAPLFVAAATLAAAAALTFAAAPAQAATTTLCNAQSTSVAGGRTPWRTTNGTRARPSASPRTETPTSPSPTRRSPTDQRRSGRLPLDLQGLPLGSVHLEQRPARPGREHERGCGHHELEHHPDLYRRLRRGLRHLVQPDPHHLRPAQRRGDDDLAQPQRPRQPAGSIVASNVSIGGNTYTVWEAGPTRGTSSPTS